MPFVPVIEQTGIASWKRPEAEHRIRSLVPASRFDHDVQLLRSGHASKDAKRHFARKHRPGETDDDRRAGEEHPARARKIPTFAGDH